MMDGTGPEERDRLRIHGARASSGAGDGHESSEPDIEPREEPNVEPTAEALRQLLSGPDLTAMELCKMLEVSSEDLIEYWSGSRPMTKAMALRTARLLEDRVRALHDLAAELRTAVWRLPST